MQSIAERIALHPVRGIRLLLYKGFYEPVHVAWHYIIFYGGYLYVILLEQLTSLVDFTTLAFLSLHVTIICLSTY